MEIWSSMALTASGWQNDVTLTIEDNVIVGLEANTKSKGHKTGIIVPAAINLHSHSFQRAMAGLAEIRGANNQGNFWIWRDLMYKFLQQLTPDDIEVIAAFAQMEMLESGFAHVGEFHYLHNDKSGLPYDNIDEMAQRIVSAACETGIGLTLLPALYQQAGCNGEAPKSEQLRFVLTLDQFARLFESCANIVKNLDGVNGVGVAPHSLRAVSPEALTKLVDLADHCPIHIHLGEQKAEIDEVNATFNSTPGNWLLDNVDIDESWCLIHCTQLTPEEISRVISEGASIGLCPITEANLGDGIFDMASLLANGGKFGIGTDSNIHISLPEELRTLEYSQRLFHKKRLIISDTNPSNGETIFSKSCLGGSRALCHGNGMLDIGSPADILALDENNPGLYERDHKQILDGFVFCGDNRMIKDLWVGGKLVVSDGRHFKHDNIKKKYNNLMKRISLKL